MSSFHEWFTEFEQRAIRAAGEVRETIGCGVTFHPGKRSDFHLNSAILLSCIELYRVCFRQEPRCTFRNNAFVLRGWW